MKFFNQDIIKSYLVISSLYITLYELLQNAFVNRLKGFICSECYFDENGELKFIENDEYKRLKNRKHPELENNKNEFYSCSKWCLENKIISEVEFGLIQEIRRHRNRIAHDLPRFLLDEKLNLDMSLFENCKQLLIKFEKHWVLEFEIPINSEFDGQDINENDISTGIISIVEYLVIIARNEIVKIQNLNN